MQGFVGLDLLQAGQVGSTWWVWVLIILLLVALVVWFMSLRRGYDDGEEAAPVAADDLTKIEGIGPKIAGLMKASGVATFSAMAATSVDRLQEILDGADFRAIANPSTWPEQAGLAAKGEWEALGKLQDELDGGRRA
jgi:DNA polymerase/3'-5' exonuclease PolX